MESHNIEVDEGDDGDDGHNGDDGDDGDVEGDDEEDEIGIIRSLWIFYSEMTNRGGEEIYEGGYHTIDRERR